LDKLSNKELLQELATLNPLDDRAIKILLSDKEQFQALAEALLEQKLDGDKIISINGEIVFSVKGRLIRFDALHDTDIGYVNTEGQMETADFPFKRHVFHVSYAYANGIQKSESWDKLKPAISIVIYKDKGSDDVIETATLHGKLIKSEDDEKQLQLMAVNSKKWRDVASEELRIYLSTLYNGIMTDENKDSFAGINTSAVAFEKFQRAVRIACALTKQQEYKEKGDDFMATQYATFLSEEERIAAEVKGMTVAREIYRLLMKNVPIAEIANMYQISVEAVEEFRDDLLQRA